MPYWLESDDWADDPTYGVLAKGKLAAEDALRASHGCLKSRAAHIKRDGYLTLATALEACKGRRWVLDLLCTPVLEQPPLLHRKGDECPCLGDKWIDGFDVRIHEFLKRNPSRAENDREKAKKRDRRDTALRTRVFDRDGGRCRYCLSGPLHPKAVRAKDRRRALQYDHVDPDQPGGADGANYVVACADCNEYKGQRTPYEAGMVLLPPPSPEQARQWIAATPQVCDRPEYELADLTHNTDANLRPITAGSATDQRPITDRDNEPITDRDLNPATDPDDTTTVNPAQKQGQQQADQQHTGAANPPGSGRVGSRGDDRPPSRPGPPRQPDRTGADPDIYHRRSRLNPTPPEGPDYVWPEGSTSHRPAPPDRKDQS